MIIWPALVVLGFMLHGWLRSLIDGDYGSYAPKDIFKPHCVVHTVPVYRVEDRSEDSK